MCFLLSGFVRFLLIAIHRCFLILLNFGFTFGTQNAYIILLYLENALAAITDFLVAFTPGIIRINAEKTCRFWTNKNSNPVNVVIIFEHLRIAVRTLSNHLLTSYKHDLS